MGAHDIGKHSPRAMIKRMPEPSLGGFVTNKTPHFIYLGCASHLVADVAGARTTQWYQRGGDGLKREDFFLTRLSQSWD